MESQDVTININPALGTEFLSGLNIFAGASTISRQDNAGAAEDDAYQGTGGATFSLGPVSIGAQASLDYTGEETSTGYHTYKSSAFGISFNINDDLSVSYGYHQSKKGFVNPGDYSSVTLDMESWQIAYSIGGASIRYADTNVTNAAYQTSYVENTYDKGARVLSVSLAF